MSEYEPLCFRSDMTVELVKHSASDDNVVQAARVSTKGKTDPERDEGLIKFLMRERHGSPFEHSWMTFYVQAPLFVWREHYRHRIASYNEESARYKVLDPIFYVPGPERKLVQQGKPGAYFFSRGEESQYDHIDLEMKDLSYLLYESYLHTMDLGIAREVARMILPLNIYSSAYVTMNARALMNFLSLRIEDEESAYPSHPQYEIQLVAEKYEAIWKTLMPITHQSFIECGRVAP